MVIDLKELTPVERIGNIYVKRDDKFEIFGVRGGKARSAYQLILNGIEKGYKEFVTAGSRYSPQCELVSYICENLNLKCHLFMITGKNTSVIDNILKNKLSTIHRDKKWLHLNVIEHHAIKYSEENNCCYIPFGMECKENIDITKHQVLNIPEEVKRIVVPVGSGMSMISIINGLSYYNIDKEVLGVSVGKDPKRNLIKYLPIEYNSNLFKKKKIKFTIVKSELSYETESTVYTYNGLELDKTYEAKCIPFLKDNDLLWVVGKRK